MIMLNHWLTFHVLIVMSGLIIYAVSSRNLHLRRHPSAAIAWVVALILLPYIAFPLYLMFGIRKVNIYRPAERPHKTMQLARETDSLADKTQQLALSMGLPPPAAYYRLNIHQDGAEALDALRNMIDGATRTIDLCTFLFAEDHLGNEVAQHLERRARDGIRVRLLVDGVGAYLGGQSHFKALSAAGVEVTLFVPPLRSSLRGRTNLRNHRKMVIVDQEWLLCGGRNLAAEYFEGGANRNSAAPAWVDLSFDLRGPLAVQVQRLFEQDWAFAAQGKFPAHPANVQDGLRRGLPLGQLVASGPDQMDDTLYSVLVSGFFNARKSILAVSPYFVPDPTLLMSLTLAARRGVAVDVVIPSKSNHRLADIARHRSLRQLTAAGAHVWLFPEMIHAKAVVIDDEVVLVGSANLDERSLFLNYELVLSFYESEDVRRFAAWMAQQRHMAAPYVAQHPSFWRETAEGLLIWLAFQL